jgi:hypothetical protein
LTLFYLLLKYLSLQSLPLLAVLRILSCIPYYCGGTGVPWPAYFRSFLFPFIYVKRLGVIVSSLLYLFVLSLLPLSVPLLYGIDHVGRLSQKPGVPLVALLVRSPLVYP